MESSSVKWSDQVRDTFHEIIACPGKTLKEQPHSGCRKIIDFQNKSLDKCQVPEPWSGSFETARILFIGKNPSIDTNDIDFLTTVKAGNDRKITEQYFIDRFEREKDKVDRVRCWKVAHMLAEQLLDRKVDPGSDFALTEVVHCKSKRGKGVRKAFDTCREKYLRRVVELSGAKVIVCLGKDARKGMLTEFSDELREGDGAILGTLKLRGYKKLVAWLWHPSARKPIDEKKFREPALSELQEALRHNGTGNQN